LIMHNMTPVYDGVKQFEILHAQELLSHEQPHILAGLFWTHIPKLTAHSIDLPHQQHPPCAVST
jgi:hypothetical protein